MRVLIIVVILWVDKRVAISPGEVYEVWRYGL